jgi:hypothetical protein
METKRKFVPKSAAPYVYKTYIAAEMDALMREWYANLGQTISPEELKICREIDLAEVVAAAHPAMTPALGQMPPLAAPASEGKRWRR